MTRFRFTVQSGTGGLRGGLGAGVFTETQTLVADGYLPNKVDLKLQTTRSH